MHRDHERELGTLESAWSFLPPSNDVCIKGLAVDEKTEMFVVVVRARGKNPDGVMQKLDSAAAFQRFECVGINGDAVRLQRAKAFAARPRRAKGRDRSRRPVVEWNEDGRRRFINHAEAIGGLLEL